MTALLRPAVEGDLNQVVQIERASFADPWSEESFRRLLPGDPAIFQVMVEPPDDAIVGYVIAFAVGEDAELLNVAVEPKSRGRGLAGQPSSLPGRGMPFAFVFGYSWRSGLPSSPMKPLVTSPLHCKQKSKRSVPNMPCSSGKITSRVHLRTCPA